MSAQDLLCMSMIASMNKHLPVLIVLLTFGSFGVVGDDDYQSMYFRCDGKYISEIGKPHEPYYDTESLEIDAEENVIRWGSYESKFLVGFYVDGEVSFERGKFGNVRIKLDRISGVLEENIFIENNKRVITVVYECKKVDKPLW